MLLNIVFLFYLHTSMLAKQSLFLVASVPMYVSVCVHLSMQKLKKNY